MEMQMLCQEITVNSVDTFDEPKNPLVNVLTKKMEVSNWAPTWSLEELRAEQKEDNDLCTVIYWIMSHSVPTEFPKQSSHTVQTLWNQRNSLVLDQGVLFRRWEDIPRCGNQQTLQLVVPHKLIQCILEPYTIIPWQDTLV